MRRYFGRDFDKFHITSHKGDLAKKGVILIDDREDNVTRFALAGGVGIVFPSVGSQLHEESHDPLKYVKEQLELYTYVYGDG